MEKDQDKFVDRGFAFDQETEELIQQRIKYVCERLDGYDKVAESNKRELLTLTASTLEVAKWRRESIDLKREFTKESLPARFSFKEEIHLFSESLKLDPLPDDHQAYDVLYDHLEVARREARRGIKAGRMTGYLALFRITTLETIRFILIPLIRFQPMIGAAISGEYAVKVKATYLYLQKNMRALTLHALIKARIDKYIQDISNPLRSLKNIFLLQFGTVQPSIRPLPSFTFYFYSIIYIVTSLIDSINYHNEFSYRGLEQPKGVNFTQIVEQPSLLGQRSLFDSAKKFQHSLKYYKHLDTGKVENEDQTPQEHKSNLTYSAYTNLPPYIFILEEFDINETIFKPWTDITSTNIEQLAERLELFSRYDDIEASWPEEGGQELYLYFYDNEYHNMLRIPGGIRGSSLGQTILVILLFLLSDAMLSWKTTRRRWFEKSPPETHTLSAVGSLTYEKPQRLGVNYKRVCDQNTYQIDQLIQLLRVYKGYHFLFYPYFCFRNWFMGNRQVLWFSQLYGSMLDRYVVRFAPRWNPILAIVGACRSIKMQSGYLNDKVTSFLPAPIVSSIGDFIDRSSFVGKFLFKNFLLENCRNLPIYGLFAHPQVREQLGAIPKHCLFTGPPGAGKTFFAKLIASESNVAFITSTSSQFMSETDGRKVLRKVFEYARQRSPSILFIDEIEVIGISRTTPHARDQLRRVMKSTGLLTLLLVLLEKISTANPLFNRHVTVIGATNESLYLDPALTRSGRFELVLRFELPNGFVRKQMMALYGHPLAFSSDIRWDRLIDATKGYSGAEISLVMGIAERYVRRVQRNRSHTEDSILHGCQQVAPLHNFIFTDRVGSKQQEPTWFSEVALSIDNIPLFRTTERFQAFEYFKKYQRVRRDKELYGLVTTRSRSKKDLITAGRFTTERKLALGHLMVEYVLFLNMKKGSQIKNADPTLCLGFQMGAFMEIYQSLNKELSQFYVLEQVINCSFVQSFNLWKFNHLKKVMIKKKNRNIFFDKQEAQMDLFQPFSYFPSQFPLFTREAMDAYESGVRLTLTQLPDRKVELIPLLVHTDTIVHDLTPSDFFVVNQAIKTRYERFIDSRRKTKLPKLQYAALQQSLLKYNSQRLSGTDNVATGVTEIAPQHKDTLSNRVGHTVHSINKANLKEGVDSVFNESKWLSRINFYSEESVTLQEIRGLNKKTSFQPDDFGLLTMTQELIDKLQSLRASKNIPTVGIEPQNDIESEIQYSRSLDFKNFRKTSF